MNSATQIQAMVRNMDHSKTRWRHLKSRTPEEYLGHLQEENKTLFESYPALFALHADDKLDETFFFMLQQKRKMERGELNEDQASAIVGQKLFDRWVGPIVNPRSAPAKQTTSYEEYYRSQSE
jgi:hypothetical protein